jgi:hypothetical protein
LVFGWYKKLIKFLRALYVNKKLPVFFVFLLLASTFWILSALGEKYFEAIYFPVRYANAPKDKLLVNELPDRFSVRINSTGYDILATKLKSGRSPIQINLSNTRMTRDMRDTSRYYILTSSLAALVRKNLSREAVIISISPDTVWVHYSKMHRKTVPVIADIHAVCQKQYMITEEIYTIPKKIEIAGPKALLDEIDQVETVHREFPDLSDSVRLQIPLKKNYSNIDYSQDYVDLMIPVEQFTESSVTIPVEVEGLPDTLRMKLFPARVNVTFRVGLSAYHLISPDDFHLSIAYDSLDRNDDDFFLVTPVLDKSPVFVDHVRISPKEIEYLIEEK